MLQTADANENSWSLDVGSTRGRPDEVECEGKSEVDKRSFEKRSESVTDPNLDMVGIGKSNIGKLDVSKSAIAESVSKSDMARLAVSKSDIGKTDLGKLIEAYKYNCCEMHAFVKRCLRLPW